LRRALAVTLLALAGLLPCVFAAAQSAGEDRVDLRRSSALLGEHLSATLRVTAPAGTVVEITPGGPSWAGVELVTTASPSVVTRGTESLWIFEVKVAPLLPGDIAFAPTVVIVSGAEVTARTLPPVPLTVLPTLGPDDPLELTPLLPPVAIEGAESPLLRPAIAAGAALGIALLGLLGWVLAKRWVRRPRRVVARPAVPQDLPGLHAAEAVIDTDPVSAYRVMSSVVKAELARRYGLRATALTTNELRRRLEDRGVDRWQARLVGGLLEECDAVIYAGYRPATERRQADLTMAREIVEVTA
jgi:hypothetical protein